MIREDLIEKGILPLVKAINETNLFSSFSSCEGHFGDNEQDQCMDRNKADVRFDPESSTSLGQIEHFITYLITEFNNKHGFDPIVLTGYKSYAPDDNYNSNFFFVIQLAPFDRSVSSRQKRHDTDRAVLQAAEVVRQYQA